ncbi:MAG: ATP-binding protein [Alphaproteobacteria bacterium]
MEFLDRRQQLRKKVILHAFISDRGGDVNVKCVIREISKNGCRIATTYVEHLPRVVQIIPEGFDNPITGKIIWRTSKVAGIQFISEEEALELDKTQPVPAREHQPAGFFNKLQSFVSLRRREGFVTAGDRPSPVKQRAEFKSAVLHGLRHPLTALKDLLKLLMGGAIRPIPRRAKSVIKAAYQNADKVESLIEEAMHAEKIETGQLPCKPKPTEIVTLANDVLLTNTSYAAKYDVRFEMKDDVGSATVQADARRLEEVIGNLLSNAAKMSPKGELVTLSLTRTDGRIRLAVKDGGLGTSIHTGGADGKPPVNDIAGEAAQWLRICHSILEKHGSELHIEAKPGKGTTAWFDLKESA